MKSLTQVRESQNSGQDRSMRNLKPGRSMAPPKTELQAGDGFLKSTVGRRGENRPEDLRKLGQFLYDNHAPLAMVADLMNVGNNGNLIERYQSEVLGFRNPDGRIDPGGKTITAIRELKGREIVAGWYGITIENDLETTTAPSRLSEKHIEKESAKLEEGERWIIPPLLSKSSYITQAPPAEAAGATTLTTEQLFSHALADYGPGRSRDIKKPENWTKHSRWNHKKYGHWKDYAGALRATHWIACHNTCIYMAQKAGVGGVSQSANYNSKMKASNVKGTTAESLIDPQLATGNVVVARVGGHHSILIIGMCYSPIFKPLRLFP